LFIVLWDKIDFLFYAGDADTSDHAAHVAEARRGKQKVNEGHYIMSQLLASGPVGDPVVHDRVIGDVPADVGNLPHGVSLPHVANVNPVQMLDEEDDDWLLQVVDIAEAEYFKSQASKAFDWGDIDDELDSQAAHRIEAEYAEHKAVVAKHTCLLVEDPESSDEELLPDYLSHVGA
jgi:hypothetical protein